MHRLAVILALVSCAPALTPAQDADLEYRRALSSHDPAEAIRHLDLAIKANPRIEYHAHRARLRLELMQERAAFEDYTAGLALEGLPAARAQVYLDRSRLQKGAAAEADLNEAIKLMPGYTEAWLERARLRRRLGRPKEADEDLAEARKLGIDRADGYYNEAVRAITKGDTVEGERMIGFALDLDPGHSRAHVAKARLHMERHLFEEAAREFDAAILVHPKEPDLYYYRATALLAAARPQDALRDFEKAVELAKEAPYIAGRALAKHRLGQDYAAVMKDLEQAATLDPNCYAAWFNRGVVEQDRRDFEASEKAFRRANAIRSSPEGSIALGRVLHERARYDMALDLYRQALEIYRGPEVQQALRDEIERTRRAKEANP